MAGALAIAIGVVCSIRVFCGGDTMSFRLASDLLVLIWIATMCFTELNTRRIPNILSLGGLVAWLALDIMSGSLLEGIEAVGVGMVFMFVPFALHIVGAGVVKATIACCAYIGLRRLLPFSMLYVLSGLVLTWWVWRVRHKNPKSDKTGISLPGSPILATATLVVIILKWIGWIV